MERRTGKCLTFVIRQISSKIFGKNTQALRVISKSLGSSFPRMTEQIQISPRRLKCF